MRVFAAKLSLFAMLALSVLLCAGCDSGVFDIVLGSLRLAEGIVSVAT